MRVLLVSSAEGLRDAVGEALAERAGDHRLYWVAQAGLAPVRAGDMLPHVILVDDELGEASPGPLIGQLASKMPSAAILAIVSDDGVGAVRQAVLAGARGFVTKPIQPDDLVSAIRQVLGQRAAASEQAPAPPATGRIVVFCAPKGGTGRTTLAINTAIALGQVTGEPLVLIDADYSAPALDVALNVDASRSIVDLLPKLSRLDAELIEGVLATHASGIRVLLAPPPADLTHPISLPQVQQVLAWLKRVYPWVVVDLGLPMDETAFAFLDGADRIVMTVLPEMVGLRNTRLMLDQLHGRSYPAAKVWLVLNRANLRGGVPVKNIEEQLRVQVKYQIPDDQPLVTHTINRGVPFMVSHRNSALARAVQGLARQLAQELPSPKAVESNGGGRFSWLNRTPRSAEAS